MDAARSRVLSAAATEFAVLQLLKVRGIGERADLATALDDPSSLDRAIAAGRVTAVAAGEREFLRLSEAGEERRLADLAEARTEVDFTPLEEAYEGRFLRVNARFKSFCATWQEADDRVALLDPMLDIHEAILPVLAVFADPFPHYGRFRAGFEAAAEKVELGEPGALTGTGEASYHSLWFELHEDLLQLLGRSRADEEA